MFMTVYYPRFVVDLFFVNTLFTYVLKRYYCVEKFIFGKSGLPRLQRVEVGPSSLTDLYLTSSVKSRVFLL